MRQMGARRVLALLLGHSLVAAAPAAAAGKGPLLATTPSDVRPGRPAVLEASALVDELEGLLSHTGEPAAEVEPVVVRAKPGRLASQPGSPEGRSVHLSAGTAPRQEGAGNSSGTVQGQVQQG